LEAFFTESIYISMAFGQGYGKTILFGEHFVVYGLPSIASAIDSKTICTVERSGMQELIDDRPATPGYKQEKYEQYADSIKRVLTACGLSPGELLRITFAGDLYVASGIGASAAACAALARALNEEYKLKYHNEKINEIAYEGEKAYHGTPSGIDNTAAVYGGLIWFVRNMEGGKNTIELIKMKEPVEIVLGNTGITSSTVEVVGDVQKQKKENPEKFSRIFEEYKKLAVDAKTALEESNLEKIGALMNQNHKLLQDITVSCKELDLLVEAALKEGALGAKLTGTGRGGLMIALTPGRKLQEKVAAALEAKGFKTTKTKIGV
jgi:mevalonate kinase